MKFLDRFLPSFVEKKAQKAQASWAKLTPDQRVNFLKHTAQQRLSDVSHEREAISDSMKRSGILTGGAAAASAALLLVNPPVALVVAMGAGTVMAFRALFQSEASNVQQERERTLKNIVSGSHSMEQRAAEGDNFQSIERTLGMGWNSPDKITQWLEQTHDQQTQHGSEVSTDHTFEHASAMSM